VYSPVNSDGVSVLTVPVSMTTPVLASQLPNAININWLATESG
jgi:hypothetical protein